MAGWIIYGLGGLLATGVFLFAFLTFFIKYHRNAKQKAARALQKEWDKAGKDVVVLHMPQRAIYAPNPSPFPMKLETWLRMNKVKYVPELGDFPSPKDKTPWITFNGENISDSQLSIDHIKRILNIDPNAHLTDQQRGLAKGLRVMADDHLYFLLVIESYIHHDGKHFLTHYPPDVLPQMPEFLIKLLLKTQVKSWLGGQAKAQGLGRHTKEEVRSIGITCLEGFDQALGDQPYLMGDMPCEEDAAVFGQLAWMLYCVPDDNYFKAAAKDRFPKLVAYVERIKDKYWPDWDSCTYYGQRNKK